MSNKHQTERNQEASIYVGNLDERVTEPLLWELFLQVAPVKHVHVPKERITSVHQGFGFVEFYSENDAEYAVNIMNLIKVYGKALRVNKAAQGDKKQLDVGANLFIGNLAPEVDEALLQETFKAFGKIIQAPKIGRDEAGGSRGFGFVSYDAFESADMAIAAMNGQWLANKQITVSFAFKKDSQGTERHGSAAERLLAQQAKQIAAEKAAEALAKKKQQSKPSFRAAPTFFPPPQNM